MIYAGDFRKGMTFEIDGDPHVVLDFQHVKPGKGAAFVRTKHKNILTGAIKEESFNPDAKFPKHTSRQKRCSTYITTANCTISWMKKLTIRFLLHLTR